MRLPVFEPVLELSDENGCLSETPLNTRQRHSRRPTASTGTHFQDPCQQKKPPPLGALVAVQQIPPPQLLQLRVAAPPSQGDFVPYLDDVIKPRGRDEGLCALGDLKGLAGGFTG